MSLNRLPNELILIISGYLDDCTIANLLRANKGLCFLLTPALHQRALIPPGSGAMTRLQWAALRGYVPLVKLLLSKRVGLDSEGKVDPEALRGAIASGHDQISFLLLQAGANVARAGFRTGTLLYHLLYNRSSSGNVRRLLRMLRDCGADFSAPDFLGKIPLHRATQEGDVERVKLLLQLGTDPNSQTHDGQTALFFVYDSQKIIRLLIEAGADPNIGNISGETPLYRACKLGHLGSARMLLEYGANPRGNSPHYRPILSSPFPELVELLVSHGEDIHAEDVSGLSLIHRAAQGPYPGILKKLLDLGADVNRRNPGGATPLHFVAASEDKGQCTLMLINAGAEVDCPDNSKYTALHWAARSGCYLTTAVLLAMGADFTVLDNEGRSPLDRTFDQRYARHKVVETILRGSWKRHYGREMVPAYSEFDGSRALGFGYPLYF
ncbi:ankyrin repeat-containing domain protein [Tuber brumale]|nr:ankyrin repeat-containing domain protein [Tuber brumale]